MSEFAVDDYMNMLSQLGIKEVRNGAEAGNDPAAFDETAANPYWQSMPDSLTMHDGTKVTAPSQWPARRAEILEDFSREIYGRIPVNVPSVTWEVTATTQTTSSTIPVITKTLVGRVNNAGFPQLSVNIQATFTVPANATGPVPLMMEIGTSFGGARGTRGGNTPWTQQAVARGWAYASISTTSIQPDNVQLNTGIIALASRGTPRKPDDWGVLRAWQWGVSRFIDYVETHPDSHVDAKKNRRRGPYHLRQSRHRRRGLRRAHRHRPHRFLRRGRHQAQPPRASANCLKISPTATTTNGWPAISSSMPPPTPQKPPPIFPSTPTNSSRCAPRARSSSATAPSPMAKPTGSIPMAASWPAVLAGPVYRLLGKRDFGVSGDYPDHAHAPNQHTPRRRTCLA